LSPPPSGVDAMTTSTPGDEGRCSFQIVGNYSHRPIALLELSLALFIYMYDLKES
jgi:hypothetical protein